MTFVFYISGHGFGHASRQIEIINALFAQRLDVRVVVRTSAARWLFERTLRGPATVQSVACDTGAVQRGALEIDVEATIREAAAFHAEPEARIDAEARALAEIGADVVIGDVPPLAFAAAARAGVRSVAISNFTWDWIYGAYTEALPQAPWLIDRLRSWYGLADEAWRMPLAGGFEGMRVTADLPLVARRARHAPADVRARLGLPARETLLLVSFGGYQAHEIDVVAAAGSLRDARIVVTTQHGDPPIGTLGVDEHALYGSGLRYEDLVAAVDIVLTKPGYGIVSECIANGTRLLYTSRGRFREYDVFVAQMPSLLPCEFISREELATGRWQDAVARLLAQPHLAAPASNGAEIAATRLLALAAAD